MRYLADVFYLPDKEDVYAVAEKEKYLKQELVDVGLLRGIGGGKGSGDKKMSAILGERFFIVSLDVSSNIMNF